MEVRSLPVRGQKWRHFLGGVYTIQYIARHPIYPKILMVVYSEDYVKDSGGVNEGMWAVPLDTFMARINRILYPNAPKGYYFEKV